MKPGTAGGVGLQVPALEVLGVPVLRPDVVTRPDIRQSQFARGQGDFAQVIAFVLERIEDEPIGA